MKKLFFSIAITAMLGGCAEKKIKQKELEYQRARQVTIDSINTANKEQRRLDSLAAVASVTEPVPVVAQDPDMPAKPAEKRKTGTHTTKAPAPAPSPTPVTNKKTETGTTTTEKQPETAETKTATPEEKKKKGLNNAAKGAIIGLGTGAAAGAVINKNNRGKGAVVGGVIGAIGGAVGGAVIDKQKEKKAKRDSTAKRDTTE
jgi:hypothetical protein